MLERRSDLKRREQFERVRLDLLERLRRVCAARTPSELHQLVRQMVRVQLKYETRTAVPAQGDLR